MSETKEITKEQIEQHKSERLRFVSYYKYQFFYANEKIRIATMGYNEDIYRAYMVPEMTLKEIVDEAGEDLYITIESV